MRNVRPLLAAITAVHRFLYRATRGRVGGRLLGNQMLLLATVGRRSGAPREVPLLALPDGERWLVIASNAGDDRAPAWWLNLLAAPEAEIQVGARRLAVRARAASAAERPRLWERFVAAHASYADYEKRTSREIPIVILEPR
jgi:deazaflavin-dependent oxidoreductase (nitroreductase family)